MTAAAFRMKKPMPMQTPMPMPTLTPMQTPIQTPTQTQTQMARRPAHLACRAATAECTTAQWNAFRPPNFST
jgi:hypothetical protein